MTLLQLEVPLLALSLTKVTVTVPQPLVVVTLLTFGAGTWLKHWTLVFAGQVITGPLQVVGWLLMGPEGIMTSVTVSGLFVCQPAVFQVMVPELAGAVAVKTTSAKGVRVVEFMLPPDT